MSRVGKKKIELPKDIEIKITNSKINIKGKYGNLTLNYLPLVKLTIQDNCLFVTTKLETRKAKSYHGLIRVLIQNSINGVFNNYTKILCLEGIGFKFLKDDDLLIVYVGFTHSYNLLIPKTLIVELSSPTKIQISGPSKEEVNTFTDIIRKIKLPEPYKGKGVLYEGEQIFKKIGKTRR